MTISANSVMCIGCGVEMSVDEIGIVVIETYLDPPMPYKLIHGDRYVCPGCGKAVVAGFGLVSMDVSRKEWDDLDFDLICYEQEQSDA